MGAAVPPCLSSNREPFPPHHCKSHSTSFHGPTSEGLPYGPHSTHRVKRGQLPQTQCYGLGELESSQGHVQGRSMFCFGAGVEEEEAIRFKERAGTLSCHLHTEHFSYEEAIKAVDSIPTVM